MGNMFEALFFDTGRSRLTKLLCAVYIIIGGAVLPTGAIAQTKLSIAALTGANEEGGMLTSVVHAALRQEIADADYDLSVTADEIANQAAPLQDDVDMSFPWYRPDCEGNTRKSTQARSLCADFNWSDPLYHVVVGYFTAKNFDRRLTSHHHVYGTTLCILSDASPQLLRDVGISDLNTRLVVRPTSADCLTAVMQKEADVSLLPIGVAAAKVEELGLGEDITPNVQLDRVLTVHAIAPLASETADDDIGLLNDGLRKIRKSGEWFEIVEQFTLAQRAR